MIVHLMFDYCECGWWRCSHGDPKTGACGSFRLKTTSQEAEDRRARLYRTRNRMYAIQGIALFALAILKLVQAIYGVR